jgi:5-methylcytosine-specific restriction endonuclease McrA
MKKNKKKYKLVRLSIHPIGDILSDVRENNFRDFRDYFCDGYKVKVKLASQRYRIFYEDYQKDNQISCKRCGIVATHFALEQHAHQTKFSNFNPVRFHFNLYGLDQYGNEILFTKDHIVPISKGGDNHIDNLQVLCTHCNLKKGNKLI